jgi:hypothetical protein
LILGLLITVTSDGEETLHPRLERIDDDIQGTQLELQKLDSGEVMLGMLYGLVVVGGLRTVSDSNRYEAMRDGRPDALVSKVRSWLQAYKLNHSSRCRIYLSEHRC